MAPFDGISDPTGGQAEDLVVHLRRVLASQPVIEQAKGMLMAQHGCTADEAFDLLREASMRGNRKLKDLAAAMIETSSHAHGDREAAVSGREAAASMHEAVLAEREARLHDVIERALRRDQLAERRDRRAERRDKAAREREKTGTPDAGTRADRDQAAIDRYESGVDRDRSADDRAELLGK
jgi:hypothetical protein